MGIARKSLIDYFSQNAAMVVTFVAGILLSRFLGVAGFGEYSLIMLANVMLTLFTNMGIEISTRVFAGKEPEKVAQIHTASVLIILVVTAISGIIIFFFRDMLCDYYFKGVRKDLLFLAALLLPFSLYQLVWQGIIVGLGEIALNARYFMWNRIAQGGIVIILIAFSYPSMKMFVFVWVVIQVIFFILSVYVMARKYRLFAPIHYGMVKKLLKFGWVVFVGNMASNLLQKYSYLIISNILGNQGVGLYSRASTFSDKITLISGSLERVTYQPAAAADEKYAPLLIQKVFRYNLYVNILGALLMYVFGSLCIRFLLQEEFHASIFPLKFLLLSVVFMSCSRILAVYFTAHLNKPHIPGIINWVVLPVSLLITYVFTKHWTLKGASVAVALIYFIHAFAFFIVFIWKNRQLKISDFFLFHSEDFREIKKILLNIKPSNTPSQ